MMMGEDIDMVCMAVCRWLILMSSSWWWWLLLDWRLLEVG